MRAVQTQPSSSFSAALAGCKHWVFSTPTRTGRRRQERTYGLLLLVFVTFPLLGSTCIPRQCEDDTFCVRSCECESAVNNQVIDCPVQFTCDIANEICEADYAELSCDDLCQQFAARDLCGSKRCVTEADCVRQVTCNSFDPNTGQVLGQFDCQRVFACDPGALACEAGYVTSTDDFLCQDCALAAN